MNLFSLSSTIYQTIVKKATKEYGVDIYDICFVRVALGVFVPAILIILYNGRKPFKEVVPELKWYMHGRNALGLITFTALVLAAKLLPIFINQIILNTAPFWAAIMTYFINNEKISKSMLICMIGCLAGIVLMAYSKKAGDTTISTKLEDQTNFYVGLACISFSSWVFALFGVFTRKMKDMHWSII